MIDVHNIAIASLPSCNDYSPAGRNLHWGAFSGINILAFVVFEAAPTKRISTTTNTALELAKNGPY